MANIYVSGIAGYVGSTLLGYLLNAGHRVFGVDNLMYRQGAALLPHLGHKNFMFLEGSVCDPNIVWPAVKHVDVVIHLAALVGAPACDKLPDYAEEINTEAVSLLMKHVKPHQHLIFPCTNSGYGAKPNGVCTEQDEQRPLSLYARTKVEAERLVLQHPNAVSLRLATVCGASPRMRLDLLVNDWVWELRTRQKMGSKVPLQIYEPHFRRNLVHVRDVARCILHMIECPQAGIFNCGLPEGNLTKWELAEKICEVLHFDKKNLAEGRGSDPDQRDYVVCNDKLLATGFRFEHSLEDAIREIRSLRDLTVDGKTNLGITKNA
jgi:nucleoside-diphosphate-sugar epimerase